MPARQVVLLTSSESSHPTQLPSRQQSTPLNPLAATLVDLPASVANKRLTAELSPLDATLTKNRGVGVLWLTSFLCLPTFQRAYNLPLFSIVSTLFRFPYPATPVFATLTKTAGCVPTIPILVHPECSRGELCAARSPDAPSADSALIQLPSLDFQLSAVDFRPPDPLSPFLAALPSHPGEADKILAGSVGRSASHFTVQLEIWLCV